MKGKPPPPSGGDGWLIFGTVIFIGIGAFGAACAAWDAGREYGRREQSKKDHENGR